MAHFFTPAPEERILDLGTGCGIISLILAHRWSGISLTGLELQPGLAALARFNVAANRCAGRVRIVEGDLGQVEKLLPPAGFERVVCNPPYRQVGAARPNSNLEQATARHEIRAGLEDIVKAVAWLLVEGGRADLVYPVERGAELQRALQANGCSPSRLQRVCSYQGGACRLLLLEAIKGGAGKLETLPPFYVHEGPLGQYTTEMANFYLP